MKQLKFMIAAAAAIGLAGAAQAAFPSTTELDAAGNTGFEEFEANTAATTGTDDYFRYTGNNPEDNESKIIAGSATLADGVEKSGRAKGAKFNANANVLEVNTGTDPLLRTINPVANNDSSAVDVPAETGIYIDTLVQFTVTPNGDSVAQTADDKLMIYLQETNTVDGAGVVTAVATNLMVKAGFYTGRNVQVKDYKVSSSVKPGVWYRLTVKASSIAPSYVTDEEGTETHAEPIPVFYISLDGTDLRAETPVAFNPDDDETQIVRDLDTMKAFPSLLMDDTTLKAVGFAGEGKVDDIVFSTTQEAIETSVDFTLTADGVSSVWTTIGNEKFYLTDDGKLKLPAGTTSFAIEYEPSGNNFWNPQYTEEFTQKLDCDVNGLMVTINGANPGVTFTVTATEGASAPTVDENATAGSVGIITDAFSSDKGAALQKVVDWAVKAGLTKAQLNEMAPFEDETGNATNELQEAFLLNCAVSELADVKAAFKVGALTFDQDGNPVPPAAATSWVDSNDNVIEFNAVPAVLGASELGGTWETATTAHKFFKAVLTK